MKTFFARVPGLGEAYLQVGDAEGRRWLDASIAPGEAQLWLGSSTLIVSPRVSGKLKASLVAMTAFLGGFGVDIQLSEAGTVQGVVLSNASIAILQTFGY